MSSPKSSPSSSRSTSPNAEDDSAASHRLAQLEAMLQASMGYGLQQEQDSPMDDVVGDEPMLQQSKVDEEDSIAEPAQPAAAEQVAFRLFSTQKAPQTVIIKEAEDDWPTVKDPRVRDVSDEDKAAVKERKRAIAALAVDGAFIIAESSRQPATRFPARITTRRLALQPSPAPRPPFPSLAYLKADLPSTATTTTAEPTRIAPPPLATTDTSTTSKKRRRPPQPKRQALRRPLAALDDVPLFALPILAVEKDLKPAKAVSSVSAAPRKEKPKGNKRLSKERRALLKTKLGKNAKKNKRKKAKAKLKAQA